MYGEDLGTSTLARMLKIKSEQIYHDLDDGVSYEDTLENAKKLMEGAFVLWERLAMGLE